LKALAAAAFLLACAAIPSSAQDEAHSPPSPASRPAAARLLAVRAAVAALADAQVAFAKRYAEAGTDEARRALLDRESPDPKDCTARLRALVDLDPADAAAGEALLWIAASGAPHAERSRADRLLLEHHSSSPVLALAFQEWERAVSIEHAAILRRALLECPHREMRGRAAYSLARLLRRALEIATAVADRKLPRRQIEAYEQEYGETTLVWLGRQDRAQLDAELTKLLEQCVVDYGDLVLDDGGSLAERAKGELYELRVLAVGNPAPEIAGRDANGTAFKLSDYRGKVVVLDFWFSWCEPWRAALPAKRALVERLAGRPFAYIGISGEETVEKLQRFCSAAAVTWRSFHDGPPMGPIATRWNVGAWPMLYVLDAHGVIRCKGLRQDALDGAVDALLAEAEKEAARDAAH
jgi:peroxiredoxin